MHIETSPDDILKIVALFEKKITYVGRNFPEKSWTALRRRIIRFQNIS